MLSGNGCFHRVESNTSPSLSRVALLKMTSNSPGSLRLGPTTALTRFFDRFTLHLVGDSPLILNPVIGNGLRHLRNRVRQILRTDVSAHKRGQDADPFQGHPVIGPSLLLAFPGLGHVIQEHNAAIPPVAVKMTRAERRRAAHVWSRRGNQSDTPTVALIVPPVMAVATFARSSRKAVPVTTTGVKTVLAVVVLTADPRLNHETLSRLPCICTDPAETPADETTTMTAVVRITKPSNAVPPPVADTAVRETAGANPYVFWTIALPALSQTDICQSPIS